MRRARAALLAALAAIAHLAVAATGLAAPAGAADAGAPATAASAAPAASADAAGRPPPPELAWLQEFWNQRGDAARQARALRESGEALAAAGDARGALELYHRERALTAAQMQASRDGALKELQARHAADARQRDIELLERDNALKTAALANRGLQQRLWALLAAVALLAVGLVAILYRRVRETRQRLEASHRLLQDQSERDPLTGLANRRHCHAVMAQLSAAGTEAALLLVDIDHFKRINDLHGHAAGDRVLIEVARRLGQAVRGGDLVVRWGGEEFLVLAPRASAEQAEQMAARLLGAVGATPIDAGAQALRITASIGYARLPLRAAGSAAWDATVDLADMALYNAKNQGRNRAVGVVEWAGSAPAALREIGGDLDRARRDGRVTLRRTAGPEPACEPVRDPTAA